MDDVIILVVFTSTSIESTISWDATIFIYSENELCYSMCAAGIAVLDIMKEPGFSGHVMHAGEHLLKGLRALPFRTCLAVGEVTNHYPFVINTKSLSVQTAVKTRLYFKEV
jgi:4-aminobutyrate aminotransferase-like enzyme